MDLEHLPDADELWWRFALAAAVDQGSAKPTFFYRPESQVLTYTDGDTSLSIQRLYHGRIVLWGNAAHQEPRGRWTGIPGWATSDAVRASLEQVGATFLLWHARDGWESTRANLDIGDIVAPITGLELSEETMALARAGTIEDATLADLGADDPAAARSLLCAAAGETTSPVQGTVREVLATEIRAQMRMTPERDRLLPHRPVPLVRWAIDAKPPAGFHYVVRASRTGLIRISNFIPPLPAASARALHDVLAQIYQEEVTEQAGGWLFARVLFNGIQIQLDRAFDSLPAWAQNSPTLEELTDEIGRRDPAWRPAWARLLPQSSVLS